MIVFIQFPLLKIFPKGLLIKIQYFSTMNSKSSCIALLMLVFSGLINVIYADTIPAQNLSRPTLIDSIFVQNDSSKIDSLEKEKLTSDSFNDKSLDNDIQSIILSDNDKNKSSKDRKVQEEIDPESYHARKASIWGILPGGGQIYNKRWWKAPIAWAMIGGGGFLIYNSASKMRTYNQALTMRNNGQTDEFLGILSEAQIISYRNSYRRNLQLSVFGTVGLWSLTILDAVVDAHLKTYDISDNLSIKFKPKILRVHNNSVPSFAITLYL